MKKVVIDPGVCGFVTSVVAEGDEDEGTVTLKVASGCEAVRKMMEAAGDTFDAYELCLTKPGAGPLYEYAGASFPVHAGCPVLAGILKCAEAEAGLALVKDVSIKFEETD